MIICQANGIEYPEEEHKKKRTLAESAFYGDSLSESCGILGRFYFVLKRTVVVRLTAEPEESRHRPACFAGR
jgi:hypothetical protein